jgi:hypothetical protein
MPSTKAQSKQKRTLQPKQCAGCYKKCQELLDMAVANERLEFERDVMMDVMAKALEMTNRSLFDWISVAVSRIQETSTLIAELSLVQANGTAELTGKRWIDAAGVVAALNRYTNGRCVK